MPVRTNRTGDPQLIAVVGPCTAGKSSLVRSLRAYGFDAREVAQEHSCVPDMWSRLTSPDILIYLDVSEDVAAERGHLSQTDLLWWRRERSRLAHARQNAHIVIQTDTLTESEVAERALQTLLRGGRGQEHVGVAGLAR